MAFSLFVNLIWTSRATFRALLFRPHPSYRFEIPTFRRRTISVLFPFLIRPRTVNTATIFRCGAGKGQGENFTNTRRRFSLNVDLKIRVESTTPLYRPVSKFVTGKSITHVTASGQSVPHELTEYKTRSRENDGAVLNDEGNARLSRSRYHLKTNCWLRSERKAKKRFLTTSRERRKSTSCLTQWFPTGPSTDRRFRWIPRCFFVRLGQLSS